MGPLDPLTLAITGLVVLVSCLFIVDLGRDYKAEYHDVIKSMIRVLYDMEDCGQGTPKNERWCQDTIREVRRRIMEMAAEEMEERK